MITASANFITEVTKLSRNFRARFYLDGAALSCDIKSIRIHKGSGTDVIPGSVFIPYIEAELLNCSESLKGEDLTLDIGVRTGSDAYDDITIGTFYVTSAKGDTTSLSITAVGILAKSFQTTYVSALSYPTTINSVLSEIATKTGVPISLKGLTGTANLTTAITDHTYLDTLGIIAGLLGGFVTEDNDGGVVIAAYGSGSTLAVDGDRSATEPEVNDNDYTITGIKCIVEEGDDDTPEVSYQYGTVNVEYHNAYMTAALFNQMYGNIVGYSFRPGNVPLTIGDPRLEAGDVLSVTDLDGDTYSVPCIAVEHYFDGGVSTSVDAEVQIEEEAETVIRGPVTIAAEAATRAASTAQRSADAAQESANAAQESADEAQASADAAQTSANEAKASAKNANDYAARALGNLSTVQSVAETLNWITRHGTMTLTTDTALDPSHVYFIADSDGDYEISGQSYSVVSDPDVADIGTYYQLSIDESLNNYVGTHLALTSEGLWLVPDSTDGNRVLISTGGSLNMSLSVDENGRLIYSNSSGVPILFDMDDEGNLISSVEDDETAEVSLDENDHAILESGATPYSTAGTYILDGDGEVVARFLSDIAQIGADSAAHTEIDAYGQRTYASDGETLLAEFAPTGAQIGDADGAHIEIDSSGQRIYDSDGVTELASFSGSGAQIGQDDQCVQITPGAIKMKLIDWYGNIREFLKLTDSGGGLLRIRAPYVIGEVLQYFDTTRITETGLKIFRGRQTTEDQETCYVDLNKDGLNQIIGSGTSADPEIKSRLSAWELVGQVRYGGVTVDTVDLDIEKGTLDLAGVNSGLSVGNGITAGGHPSGLLAEDIVVGDGLIVAAGQYGTGNVSITKSGYTPLGIVGIHLENATSGGIYNTYVFTHSWYINNGRAYFVFRNTYSADAKIKVTVTVLYAKT